MSPLTHSELTTLFASANIQATILKQGQIGRNNGVPVEFTEVTVTLSTGANRAQCLRNLRHELRRKLRSTKNATGKAFTYGGSIVDDGAFSSVTVGFCIE